MSGQAGAMHVTRGALSRGCGGPRRRSWRPWRPSVAIRGTASSSRRSPGCWPAPMPRCSCSPWPAPWRRWRARLPWRSRQRSPSSPAPRWRTRGARHWGPACLPGRRDRSSQARSSCSSRSACGRTARRWRGCGSAARVAAPGAPPARRSPPGRRASRWSPGRSTAAFRPLPPPRREAMHGARSRPLLATEPVRSRRWATCSACAGACSRSGARTPISAGAGRTRPCSSRAGR